MLAASTSMSMPRYEYYPSNGRGLIGPHNITRMVFHLSNVFLEFPQGSFSIEISFPGVKRNNVGDCSIFLHGETYRLMSMDLISTLLESIFDDIFFQVQYLPPIQGAAAGSLNFTGHAEAMLVT
jgi:hypothetical protein